MSEEMKMEIKEPPKVDPVLAAATPATPVAEPVPASEPAPVPVEPPVVEDAIKKQIEEISSKIDVEDNDKIVELEKKYETKLTEQMDEFKKDYLNQMTSINKKLDEYSGRKGLVDNTAPNPTIPAVETETPASVEVKDPFAINNIKQEDDRELAKKFVEGFRQ